MYHNDGDDDMAGDSPPKKSKPSRRDTLVDEEEEEEEDEEDEEEDGEDEEDEDEAPGRKGKKRAKVRS